MLAIESTALGGVRPSGEIGPRRPRGDHSQRHRRV